MNAQRAIATFWNRRWLILTTTVAVIIGGLWWAQGLPYVYNSSIVLVANSKDGNPIPYDQPNDLRRELWEQLWSKPVIYSVVQSDLFNDRRASGATNDILVERVRQSTSLIEEHQGSAVAFRLYYYDLTPDKAQMITDILGRAIESSGGPASQNKVAFKVVQSATPAGNPIKPRLFVVTIYALGGGLLLGLVLAVISELLRSRRHVNLDSSLPVGSHRI